ncbi:hypothetical protein WMC60_07880, partial [Enterococcus faecium]
MQAFEHRLPRGCEKAALHQVIRTTRLKLLLMFLIWLDLLPQMQAFEHRLPRGCEKAALHQVIRTTRLKLLLMFLIW